VHVEEGGDARGEREAAGCGSGQRGGIGDGEGRGGGGKPARGEEVAPGDRGWQREEGGGVGGVGEGADVSGPARRPWVDVWETEGGSVMRRGSLGVWKERNRQRSCYVPFQRKKRTPALLQRAREGTLSAVVELA
jgi:hypothetical protein